MTYSDSTPPVNSDGTGHVPDEPNAPESSTSLSQENFRQNFQQIVPLILAEWPQISKAKLLEAEGNLEEAISHIANQTQHTRTLVRSHLAELSGLAAEKSKHLRSEARTQVDHLIQDLETRTEQLMAEFKSEVLPELEQKARSNLGSSLLMALGFGFILGLLFGGRRG
jgi:ElaB/YqjD/DUF883 family membrane-anchored ribosome-binding protein